MKLAKKKDKAKVVAILEKSFAENKTLLFLTRRRRHIHKIAEYAFDYALRRKGVFLSDSGNGVAICYQYNRKNKDWLDYFYEIKLFFRALSLKRVHKIIAHTKKIENTRPKDGNFLYFWFFGARPESLKQNSAKELYLSILKLAKKKQLNIYAETTILKNKNVYERFGFEVYKQWFNPDSGFNVWFMRKLVV